MMLVDYKDADSRRIARLAPKLGDEGYRHAYLAQQLRAFLANQIRSLRGERSQGAFGKLIGKPQSVVSRLENEMYEGIGLQTLIDIARKLDIALLVRFVDFPTFLKGTEDYSPRALAPDAYKQDAIDALVSGQETAGSGTQRGRGGMGNIVPLPTAPVDNPQEPRSPVKSYPANDNGGPDTTGFGSFRKAQ